MFKGRHLEREIIVLRVRRYLRYKPNQNVFAEKMAERGLTLAPATIRRWAQHYIPECEQP